LRPNSEPVPHVGATSKRGAAANTPTGSGQASELAEKTTRWFFARGNHRPAQGACPRPAGGIEEMKLDRLPESEQGGGVTGGVGGGGSKVNQNSTG